MQSEVEAEQSLPPRRWPEGLVIRARRPADAEAVATLHNLPGFRAGTLRTPFHSPEEIRKGIEGLAAGNMALVAELDGRIVGDIGLNRLSGRRNHVASIGMGVHDDFTGRGIGSALLGEIVATADAWLNIRRLELTVFTDNVPAIALYQRFGFVREGHLRDFAFRAGRYADAYSMARLRP